MKSPQINLNTVKDLVKKLGFLKNNLALLVPILITIVAVLLFIPTKLLSGKLKQTITEQSVKTATKIDTLIRDVNEAGQAEAMEGYIQAYAQDANHIEDLMRQTTMRSLLSYRLFPDTNETSPLLFEPFRREYLAGVEAMIERLGAGGPPSEREIDAALEQSATRSMFGGRGGRSRSGGMGASDPYGGAYGGMGGMGGMGRGRNYRMMTEVDRKIIDKLSEDRAKAIRIYASPVDLDGYTFWSEWKFENRDTAIRQCWNWQMGYWILEDVMDTIEKMNAGGTSVMDSPSSGSLNVSFTLSRQSARMLGGRRRAVRREGDKAMPSYVINLRTAIAAPPCTGRFCNEEVDIIHFNARVVISADHVMPFLKELCGAKEHTFFGWYGDQPEQTFKHNQITVLENRVTPVDREDFDHSSYRYGDDAVVALDLICEYLFHKEAYDQVKPQLIKDDIAGGPAEAQ